MKYVQVLTFWKKIVVFISIIVEITLIYSLIIKLYEDIFINIFFLFAVIFLPFQILYFYFWRKYIDIKENHLSIKHNPFMKKQEIFVVNGIFIKNVKFDHREMNNNDFIKLNINYTTFRICDEKDKQLSLLLVNGNDGKYVIWNSIQKMESFIDELKNNFDLEYINNMNVKNIQFIFS